MLDWENMPDDISGYVAMVYKVIEKDTGMIYIGYKTLHKAVKRKPLKGMKRKRKVLVETDWKTYNTSSAIMQAKLVANPEGYRKVCIECFYSKTDAKAYEAYLQLMAYFGGVWSSYFNQYICFRGKLKK